MDNQVSWKERISYGLGDTASNLVFQMITMYLMFFYTDVYGLNVAAVGTLFLVARVIDAFDSPIIGVIIDRTHTKWGKSRPFFLWLAIPFGIVAVLTFMTPDFGNTGKLVYAYFTYIVLGILYAAINLPLTSLLTSMTSNSQERTVVNSVRMIFGQLGGLIVSIGALPLVAAFGKGNQQQGFLWTMVLFASIAVLLFFTTFANTRERVQMGDKNQVVPFKDGIKALKGNLPWWILLFMNVFFWVGMTSKGQSAVFYLKYNLGREDLVPLVNGLNVILLVGIALMPMLAKRIGKRNTALLGVAIGAASQLIVYVAAVLSSIPILIGAVAIGNIGIGFAAGLMFAMLADTVDYGELRSGIRAQGLLTASSSFGVKFGMGIGGAVAAWVLAIGNYVPNQEQAASGLAAIQFNFVWIPFICFLICALLLLFYKLEFDQKMIGELETQRQSGAASIQA
ncbi:glycoside/pentoside/hexuronide:cation symporter, GPH family [Paenibacillus uliginis N3/975]|uniref:Glycoside/pentoside/hexuronide:cation symporter, GPH family n=1 Tax=Paenibacillus uliginis N3/975 TaxID=1313296 RepID=A0A1X7HHJ1_9BACL|nr:MFS transporter [Paenibacillus uliginis]SMF86805.1 glycoside/pentoside/hexuronide:cation symporter, GPH family [Paenibacillus uliginis N3/975]